MMPSSHSATADSTCQHDQQRYSDHDKQTMLQAIDDLLSCTAASYFMQPLPQVDSAMDFTSLETNVLADKYSSWPSFEQDLGLIWSDPVKVLPPTSAVYKAALELKETYRSNSQSSSTANLQRVPASLKTADAIQLDTTLPVYVASIDPDSSKSSTAESTVYDRMHAPLLDYLEHSLDNPPTATTPSHRLFLKDDAATLRQHCIVHPWFYTAIVWKVSQASLSDSKFTVNVTVGRLLADHIHSMAADTNSPRSWVKFLPLTTHPRVQLDLSPAMAATFIHRRCKLTPVQPLHFQPKKDHVLIQTMKMALLGGFRASSTLPTPAVSQQSQYDDDLHLPDQQGKTVANSVAHENYSKMSQTVFSRIKKLAQSLAIPVCSEEKYHQQIQAHANAAGFFKQVWYVNHNAKLVVQAFQRMTASQRTTEIVSLLRLKSLPHMPKIVEVLHSKNDPNNLIGLSMERYERTLKHYMRPHTHSALTAHQKMDLIRQMLQCMETIHRVGIAHRDISEVNFMVNVKEGEPKLPDGSQAADLYLIDFGKAVFTTPDDLKQWWVEPLPGTAEHDEEDVSDQDDPVALEGELKKREVAKDPTTPEPLDQYKGEVMPRNLKELNVWCAQLPWIHAKPDHGYCHYRSIQTLPRNRQDRAVLPWLVHPMAEDMYSVMTLIWKVFSDMEPWYGVLDTDLRELRDIVGDEFNMKRKFDKDVYGECSRELLSLCLKVKPEERATATQVLAWLDAPGHVDALIKEWTEFAPGQRKRRRKTTFDFEERQAKYFPGTAAGSTSRRRRSLSTDEPVKPPTRSKPATTQRRGRPRKRPVTPPKDLADEAPVLLSLPMPPTTVPPPLLPRTRPPLQPQTQPQDLPSPTVRVFIGQGDQRALSSPPPGRPVSLAGPPPSNTSIPSGPFKRIMPMVDAPSPNGFTIKIRGPRECLEPASTNGFHLSTNHAV